MFNSSLSFTRTVLLIFLVFSFLQCSSEKKYTKEELKTWILRNLREQVMLENFVVYVDDKTARWVHSDADIIIDELDNIVFTDKVVVETEFNVGWDQGTVSKGKYVIPISHYANAAYVPQNYGRRGLQVSVDAPMIKSYDNGNFVIKEQSFTFPIKQDDEAFLGKFKKAMLQYKGELNSMFEENK